MPPVIVTGDDYEDGRGVRAEDGLAGGQGMLGYEADTIINIFNISKINADRIPAAFPALPSCRNGRRPPSPRAISKLIARSSKNC